MVQKLFVESKTNCQIQIDRLKRLDDEMWSSTRLCFRASFVFFYVNDIAKSSQILSFILFADDTKLFFCHKDLET